MIAIVMAVLIALLDTGIFVEHPHFTETYIEGDAVDVCGQGTALAGVIVDIDSEAQILSIDVEDECFTTHNKLSKAIIEATDMGADIIVAAWQVNREMPVFVEAVQYAEEHGATVLTSNGLEYGSWIVPSLDGGYTWNQDAGVGLAKIAGELALNLEVSDLYLPIVGSN